MVASCSAGPPMPAAETCAQMPTTPAKSPRSPALATDRPSTTAIALGHPVCGRIARGEPAAPTLAIRGPFGVSVVDKAPRDAPIMIGKSRRANDNRRAEEEEADKPPDQGFPADPRPSRPAAGAPV